jgi:CubicO group peptidase (beta-lactamase class C family)
MKLLVAVALIALPQLVVSRETGAQDARERRVDSLFAHLKRGDAPGLALAVVHDGRVLVRKGFGLANLEDRVPITPETVFDIASVSKQFAGLAVAMLIDQGKVRLTDDIRKYIPELADVGHTITVSHLLHHTSGLRDWPGTLGVAGWRMDDIISFDQILTLAYNQRTLNFVPGAEYTYSNTGYNLLAEMVARVTGRTFRAWTDSVFFRPLGMTSSQFRDDHTRVIPRRAHGYARQPDGSFRLSPNNLMALGSSSLFSTVDDLAKWVMNFDNPTVGGASAMRLLRTRGVLNDGSTIPYAFGLSHGEYRGQPTLAHSGGWASFSTYLVHFPQQRFGVIVLANSGIANVPRAAFDLADIYLEGVLGPRPAVAESAPRAGEPPVTVPANVLSRYEGVYKLAPGWYVEIRHRNGALSAQATAEREFPMAARTSNVFWVDAYGSTITFVDSAGRTTHVMYRGRRAPRVDQASQTRVDPLERFAGTYHSEELATTYVVAVRNGSLVLQHRRHGTIPLTPAWQGDFTTPLWFLRAVTFTQSPNGAISGFHVNVDERSRNILFTRRP